MFRQFFCDSNLRGNILYYSSLCFLLIFLFILFGGNKQQLPENICETSNEEKLSLENIYKNYYGTYGFDQWKEYASHYELHLNQLLRDILSKTNSFRMLEIGVQSGGSIKIWGQYFRAKPIWPFY